jgi:uncharacterized membrane protein YhaH (DUF805 family)
MPIVTAVKLGFFNYVIYKGRARRGDFWWWVLASRLGQAVASYVSDGVGLLFFFAVLLPSIMFGIRRMHDVNRSGWWILLPIGNLIFWAQPGDVSINRFGPPAPPANF